MDLVEMRYTMTSTDQSLLTEAQAAELLGIRPQTLSVWRSTKRYPLPYIRVGRRCVSGIADGGTNGDFKIVGHVAAVRRYLRNRNARSRRRLRAAQLHVQRKAD